MLSRNRLTEESPQVDLRSSNQKHGYSVRTVWPSPAPPETSCAVARPARAARRRKRAESHRSTNPNRRNRVRDCGACAPGRHGRPDEVEKRTNRVAPRETQSAWWIYNGFVQSTWIAMTVFGIALRGVMPGIAEPEMGDI